MFDYLLLFFIFSFLYSHLPFPSKLAKLLGKKKKGTVMKKY